MGRGRHITWNDRLAIERYLKAGMPIAEIAKKLHFVRSTIYKEVKRGEFDHLNYKTWEITKRYSPDKAQQRADEMKLNHGPQLKIGSDRAFASELERTIVEKKYSPAAALADIERRGLQFNTTICRTTLYSYIKKGVFLHLEMIDLPNKGQYRKRNYKRIKQKRATLGTSIENRPDLSARTDFGHWEMDTVFGKAQKSALLVLSERKTRYELILKMSSKTAASTVKCLDLLEKRFKSQFPAIFKTITCDNGSEFADTDGMERSVYGKKNRTKLYYCHPYSAYERGTNENTNRIIRRFFKKGTDFRRTPPGLIRDAEQWINDLPRKVLGFKSAAELFRVELECINAL